MRMWMLPLDEMCPMHYRGEHGEIHKHRHNFVKRHSIAGRISPVVQIEPMSMQSRHDEIEAHAGYKSPYVAPDISYLPDSHRMARVYLDESRLDLMLRCPECRGLILKKQGV